MIAVAAELRPEGSGGFASKSRRLGGENGFTLNALPFPDQQDFGSVNDKPLVAAGFRRLGQRRLDK